MIVTDAEAASAAWLREALHLHAGEDPFPWQLELLRRFLRGEAPDAIDIPTGLGKTAVIAMAQGDEFPAIEIRRKWRSKRGRWTSWREAQRFGGRRHGSSAHEWRHR